MIFIRAYHIKNNPYQTRIALDDDYVSELAFSIMGHYESRPETMGLLQVPLARLVDRDGERIPGEIARRLLYNANNDREILETVLIERGYHIELAFGHNRLAAFRMISLPKEDAPFGDDWEAEHNAKSERERWAWFPIEYADFNDRFTSAGLSIPWNEEDNDAP